MQSVEALFLDPQIHRQGCGRRLLQHARGLKGQLTVDVNEQNPAAVRFYEACGFVVEGRSPLDSSGLPFPILHMRQRLDDSQGKVEGTQAVNRCPSICVFAAVFLVAAGCDSGAPSRQPVAPKAAKLSGLPAEVTVKQRSTTVVPGSEESLRVTIDDITRGQVMTSLADKEGGAVLAATSLATGDTVMFKLGDETFQLTLKELNNALVGEDFATFTISIP